MNNPAEQLPPDHELDIVTLGRCLSDVTNAYKYYWFLTILDHLSVKDDLYIPFHQLTIGMLSYAWYPIDYYHLSFGKQDSFKTLVELINSQARIDNGPGAPALDLQLKDQLTPQKFKSLRGNINSTLKRYVSGRFLSPFFSLELAGMKDHHKDAYIKKATAEADFPVPYEVKDKGVLIHKDWAVYFQRNSYFLRGFIQWHLLQFLQRNNPNVIGLTEKLEKPVIRDLALAKKAWRPFIEQHSLSCIYSEISVDPQQFSLDHFIPWSYVGHDELWNIVPTTNSINSIKSDYLPDMSKHLPLFCRVQFELVQFHLYSGNTAVLEDYYRLFNAGFGQLSKEAFTSRLSEELHNHYRVASRLGFAPLQKQNFLF